MQPVRPPWPHSRRPLKVSETKGRHGGVGVDRSMGVALMLIFQTGALSANISTPFDERDKHHGVKAVGSCFLSD